MEDQWLKWAKRLQAIASTGLHFSKDDFDRERYGEVATIAQSMLASLGNIPIKRIEGLLSDFAKGYATPKIDVRGAVIEDRKVLLVRERSDGLWTLPGGFADVGLSATENVIKEIQEEAGIRTSVTGLYSVRHKASRSMSQTFEIFTRCSFYANVLTRSPQSPGPKSWMRHSSHEMVCRNYPRDASSRGISKLLLYSMRTRNEQSLLTNFVGFLAHSFRRG